MDCEDYNYWPWQKLIEVHKTEVPGPHQPYVIQHRISTIRNKMFDTMLY